MTLEDVSGVTKISVRNLRSLEQENFELLPGGVFNRGFVRAYAKHLGLDDDQVVADYREAAGESVASPEAPGALAPLAPSEKTAVVSADQQPEQSSAQVPWVALIGLVALGTVVLAFWSYHSHHKASETSAVAIEPGPGTRPAGASGPTPDAVAPPVAKPDASAVAANPASSGIPNLPAGATSSGFDLALRAHDEVWLSSAVDGKPPSESMMEDGQSITVHASDRAILRVGNAGALEVAFNGQKVPVHAAAGEVRTLTFTAGGLQAPAPAAPRSN